MIDEKDKVDFSDREFLVGHNASRGPSIPGTEETAKTVIIDNARAYNPTIIDSTSKNVTYLPPNANYTMDGTESYVNSGWLWPQGQVPPGAPL